MFLGLINEKKYDEALSIARKQVEDGALVILPDIVVSMKRIENICILAI